ncbi:MAG: endonuclease/exonuclease/phosphatase family protein [Chromatiaceae bacterium]|nr:endonuclease/exonuclease/phosphatase family protein [Chromatiaceae bacterium]
MIKVMTFNIRMGLANDGINHWRHRKSLALARINAFAPDLLGLQECCDDEAQAGFLKQHLPRYEFYGVQRGGNSGAAMEMAPALIKKSSFNVLEQGCFWLSETPEKIGSLNWDSAFPRTCLWFRLWHRKKDRELIFLNTHFDYQPIAMIESAKVLRAWLGKYADMPLIVTGDFNANKQSDPYRILTNILLDARPNHDNTFHDYGKINTDCPIDWILVSTHFEIKYSRIDCYHENDVYPSDHYPLLATLDWKS